MKNKLLDKKLFLIITLSISFCNNYIIFPIKIKNEFNQIIGSCSNYINYIKNNQIATYIFMGTPPKKIEIYLTSERLDFIIGEGFCLFNSDSDYNSSLSSSFIKSNVRRSSPIFIDGFFSNENIFLYNNLNLSSNVSFNNINLINCNPSKEIFEIFNNNSFCGYIGLQISSSSEYFEWNSIIHQLKSERYIDNQKWSIIFNENKINNYDGALIIGMKEEEFKDIFNLKINNNNNEYKTIYSLNTFSNSDYEIKFDEIYFEINNKNYSFNKFIQGIFIIDYDFIISNEDYFRSIKDIFFKKYIEKGICFIDKQEKLIKKSKYDIQLLNIIFCEKNKFHINDLKSFPKLKLKHIGLYQVFEFTYEDLFMETKNYFIFKIVLNENNKHFWHFGRLFLKKYQFIFDDEQKAIYYLGINDIYKKEKNEEINKIKNEDSKRKFYFLISILIIGISIIIGLFLGKIIFNKKKKKRANELDDDYEYIENKNNLNEKIVIKFDEND